MNPISLSLLITQHPFPMDSFFSSISIMNYLIKTLHCESVRVCSCKLGKRCRRQHWNQPTNERTDLKKRLPAAASFIQLESKKNTHSKRRTNTFEALESIVFASNGLVFVFVIRFFCAPNKNFERQMRAWQAHKHMNLWCTYTLFLCSRSQSFSPGSIFSFSSCFIHAAVSFVNGLMLWSLFYRRYLLLYLYLDKQ